jgi:hypothetical protein
MEATRSMALASSTEVPPNFMTIIGGRSCGRSHEAVRYSLRKEVVPACGAKTPL